MGHIWHTPRQKGGNREIMHIGYARGIKPVSTTKNSMRNKPCPCGSRKKFKKCCWSKEVY